MNELTVARRQRTADSTNTPTVAHLLQRKCACGGSPGLTGECAAGANERLTLQRRATNEQEPSPVASMVHDVLRSSGQPLDPDARAPLESRFGHDFSQVRVHTDRRAAESARAVNARAYTVGQDIVFAKQQYAPHTAEGSRLLAHELTHVVQQAPATHDSLGTLRIEPATSLAEAEASFCADAVSAGGFAPSVQQRAGAPTLRRSLLGGLLGGGVGALLGGVGGALLGSLLGPAGAVLGGIVGGLGGLLGGAALGDVATRESRSLKRTEREYAHEIFQDSIDYDAITITRGSIAATGAARTIGNTINLQPRHFVGDTLDLNPQGLLVLIHEMGHVWQYQTGGLAYIPSSLIPQIGAGLRGQSRNVVYEWRDLAKKKTPWENWNAEAQAECISDFNEALRRVRSNKATLRDYQTVALAQPYIELVRKGFGAPGSRPESNASPIPGTEWTEA